MTTPTPCYRLAGGAAFTGQDIAITVTATSTLGRNQVCNTAVATSDYIGRLRELAPGEYRVTVVHGIANVGTGARTITDTSLVVR